MIGHGQGDPAPTDADRGESGERAGIPPDAAPPPPPPPEEWFGFRLGSERRLARWPRLLAYFQALAAASNRLRYDDLGPATLGQPMPLLTISAAHNLADLDAARERQRRLADPRLRTAAERDRQIADGRTICLVTCGIHATEVGATQMSGELVHHLVTAEDEVTRRIREEVILLLMPSLNPDGLEIVADWYERTLGTPFEGSVPPELYHPYAGHDNNRDWFMQTLVETKRTVREVHRPWRPQIVLDLHQMQPTGPRYVVPPFVDPYDPNVDALIQTQANALGASVAADLTASGKTGVATSAIFDAYSPARAYSHYHGGVRILAEAASPRLATSVEVSAEQLVETRGFDPRTATHNHPAPWPGGRWSLRDVVDYHLAATLATLDHAARYRDRWLRTFALVHDRAVGRQHPFAFLVPSFDRQRDPGTARELIKLLRAGDVEVHRAATPFTADGVEIAAGTFVVPIAQPSGPFAKTLLEVQRYPDLRVYPGGPPRPPYDVTGHTLPLLMGVDAVEVASPFAVHLEPIATDANLRLAPSRPDASASHFLLPAECNASIGLVNRALAAGARVHRVPDPIDVGERRLGAGTFVVEGIAADRLIALDPDGAAPLIGAGGPFLARMLPLPSPRIGLYRSWRPSATDEGWTRFILERYGFAFRTLRDRDVRQGNLRESFDAVVLPRLGPREIVDGNDAADYPEPYTGGIGDLGIAHLRRFVEDGGTLVALDSACDMAIRALYLPVSNVLDGLRPDQFYSPGSILRLLVDPSHPLAWGYSRETVAMFVSSPAFEAQAGSRPEAEVIGRYPLTNPLLSGWMAGADRIAGKGGLVEVPVGRGRVILFGFRPQFRAQSRATYRLFFNAVYRSTLGTESARRRRVGPVRTG